MQKHVIFPSNSVPKLIYNNIVFDIILKYIIIKSLESLVATNDKIPTVIDLHQIYPLHEDKLKPFILNFEKVYVVEENFAERGLFSIISTFLNREKWKGDLISVGVSQVFEFLSSDRNGLLEKHNLDYLKLKEIWKSLW